MHYSDIRRSKCLLSIVIVLTCTFSVFSQGGRIKDAEAQVEAGSFREAEKIYLEVLKNYPDNLEANSGLGILYTEFLNDLKSASSYVNKAIALCKKDTAVDLMFAYAKCRHFYARYDEAAVYYNRCLSLTQNNAEGKKLKSEISGYLRNCTYGKEHPGNKNAVRYKVKNAGAEINSVYSDYVPVVNDHENVMLFTSRRRDAEPNKVDKDDDRFYENIYIATGEKNKFGHAKRIRLSGESAEEKAKTHESVIDISGDGKKVITFFNGDIYECDLKGDSVFGSAVKMNANVNSDYYQNHASTTADGNMIFFASDRKGGKGKLDIYYSVKQKDGSWGDAVNLGSEINTDEDEESPEISADGRTLIFASKGLPGYGKYDLFRTEYKSGKWTSPENLGAPVNSAGDDIYLRYNKDHTVAWFSSSRPEGFGEMDIYQLYYVDLPDFRHCIPFVAGESNDRVEFTCADTVRPGEKAEFNASLTKVDGKGALHYFFKVGDSTLAGDKAVSSFVFREKGLFKVRMEATFDCDTCSSPVMYCTERNVVVADKKAVDVLVSNNNGKDPLKGENLTTDAFENVYFEFNKSELTEAAMQVIDKNLAVMQAYPGALLEISSFTDSRGSSDYNARLSKQRSEAVKKYLIKKGFSKKRFLSIQSAGEKNLVNACGDGVECSEEQHAKNRRTEFRMVFKK